MKKLLIVLYIVSLLLSCKSEDEIFSIIYHGNGNTSGFVPIDTNRYTMNSNVNIKKGILAREGYIFLHWNTKEDGTGISYINEVPAHGTDYNASTTITNNINLYAVWEKIPEDTSIEVINLSNVNYYKDGNDIVIQWENPSNVSSISIVEYYYHTDETYYVTKHYGIGYNNYKKNEKSNFTLQNPKYINPPVKKLIYVFKLALSNSYSPTDEKIYVETIYIVDFDEI